MKDVLITGTGIVSSAGIGIENFEKAKNIKIEAEFPEFGGEYPIIPVKNLDITTILPSVKTYLDRASEFTLAAAMLALQSAGLNSENISIWRTGAVMGSQFGCLTTLYTYTASLMQKGTRMANPLLFSHSYLNTPISLVAIEFGIGGHHGAFAGENSGNMALESAIEALQMNRADIIIVVGVDVISQPQYKALAASGNLNYPIGEAACAFVLETRDSSQSRKVEGKKISIASDFQSTRELLGYTFAAEPFIATLMN
ncbi:MAG: beta-ketoacyl synthase N-terminal-like domain-containing protein [bacterium]